MDVNTMSNSFAKKEIRSSRELNYSWKLTSENELTQMNFLFLPKNEIMMINAPWANHKINMFKNININQHIYSSY